MQINFLLLIIIGLIAYILGFFIKDFELNKIKIHFVEKSFAFMVIMVFIAFILPTSPPTDLTNLQQALFTFASVYLGFWLSEARKKADTKDRKKKELETVRTYIFLIWEELRFNINLLDYMILNSKIGFSVEDEGLIKLSLNKLEVFQLMSQYFKNNIYHSYISSKTFVNLTLEILESADKKDELITVLDNTYMEMENLKIFLVQTTIGIRTNLLAKELIKSNFPEIQQDDTQMKNEIKMKTEEAIQEIFIANNSFKKCVQTLENLATKLGIRFEEGEERSTSLSEEEKKVIQALFNPPTQDSLKNPFNYVRDQFK